MDGLTNYWGDLASVVGLLVSLGGLGWAITEARKARSAAQAAERKVEQARIEGIQSIDRHLLAADINRAVDLIQRLKLLHITGRWDAALEQYQSLRALITSIVIRLPEQETDHRARLAGGRLLIRRMEDFASSQGPQQLDTDDVSRLNQDLNEIQSDLEDVPATPVVGRQQGGR